MNFLLHLILEIKIQFEKIFSKKKNEFVFIDNGKDEFVKKEENKEGNEKRES